MILPKRDIRLTVIPAVIVRTFTRCMHHIDTHIKKLKLTGCGATVHIFHCSKTKT